MALTGNLANFRLGDLLQTLWQNQTWGVLRLRSGSRRRELAVSPQGVALLDTGSIARDRVIERLVHSGHLSSKALELAAKQENARTSLEALLSGLGPVDSEALDTALRAEALEQIHGLLEWVDGDFELLEGEAAVGEPSSRSLDVSGFVLDAARRLDERQVWGDRFPDPEERFVACDPSSPLDEGTARMLSSFDGTTSLRAVADRITGDYFSTAKIAVELEAGGYVRRLDWNECLALAERLAAEGDRNAAQNLLRVVGEKRDPPSVEALLDLAERRRSIGDERGAAQTHCAIAEWHLACGDSAAAAETLRGAIALRPSELDLRERLAALMRCNAEASGEELFAAVRDVLLLRAERGVFDGAEDLEREVVQLLPPDPEEEAKVALALGRIGRRPAAAEILCRAGMRRLRHRGGERAAAELFQEALRLVPEHGMARAALAKTLGARSHRKRHAALILVGLMAVASLCAVPIRGELREREGLRRLQGAERLFADGSLSAASTELERVEAEFPVPSVLERAQRLRESIARASDDRRAAEDAGGDAWLRERFALAADAIDRKEFALAADAYEAILQRRPDETRLGLVRHRLQSIDRKLRQEHRRVTELARVLSQGRKQQAITSSAAADEIAALSSSGRRSQLSQLRSRIAEGPLSLALSPEQRRSFQEAVDLLGPALEKGEGMAAAYRSQMQDSEELRELEGLLVQGRTAEASGDAEAARAAFRELRERYRGEVLRPYFRERSDHWEAAVAAISRIDALARSGSSAALRAELEQFRDLYPEVKVDWVGKLPLEIRSVPPGAKLTLNGRDLGAAPVTLPERPTGRVEVVARMQGYEPATVTFVPGTESLVTVELSRSAQWERRIDASVSSEGSYSAGTWYVGDRRGTVWALDAATGEVRWHRRLETLGGIVGSPAVDADRVVVATAEGAIHWLDRSSGTAVATAALHEPLEFGPALVERDVVVGSRHGRLHVVPRDGSGARLVLPLPANPTTGVQVGPSGYALGFRDGSVRAWDRAHEVRWQALEGEPVADLAAAGAHWVVRSGARIARLDEASGALLADLDLPSTPRGALAIEDGRSSWIALEGEIVRIDLATLRIVEQCPVSTPVETVLPLPHGAFGAEPGAVRRLGTDGELQWSRRGEGRARLVRLEAGHIGAVFENGVFAAIGEGP